MKWTTVSAVAALLGAFSFVSASADPISVSLPGTTQFDGWSGSNLGAAENPGYPNHPTRNNLWPAPIGSEVPISEDAEFDKKIGSAYPGTAAIYSGGTSSAPNTFGATFSVSDSSPVTGVANVAFQVELSAPFDYDFYDGLLPVLNYNGGTQALASVLSGITSVEEIAFGRDTAEVRTYLLQWDLSAIAGITEFEIEFSNVQHSQIFSLQLDQSDIYEVLDVQFVSAVPEPSTVLLGAIGVAALGVARLARRKQA